MATLSEGSVNRGSGRRCISARASSCDPEEGGSKGDRDNGGRGDGGDDSDDDSDSDDDVMVVMVMMM